MNGKIKFLMQYLNMGNADLASLLQVDVSLVSKWRGGTRSMKSNPEYISKFITYALQIDKKNNYSKIKDILKEDYIVRPDMPVKELELLLRDWLLSDRENILLKELSDTVLNVKSMKGSSQLICWEADRGRQDAVKYFMEYASACGPGIEIICYSTEPGSWFNKDGEYLDDWRSLNLKCLEAGNEIKIIHPVNRDISATVSSMLNWVPLHVTQNVKGYYIKRYNDDSFINFTIFTASEKIALFGLSINGDTGITFTWTSRDKNLVRTFGRITKRAVQLSNPLFQKYVLNSAENSDIFYKFIGTYKSRQPCYYYNDFSCLYPAGYEDRINVLKDAGLTTAEIENFLVKRSKVEKLKAECPQYYLFDLKRVEEHFKDDEIVLNSMSVIANANITIKKKDYHRFFVEFLERAKHHSNIHMCVVDDDVGNEFGKTSLFTGGADIKTFLTFEDVKNAEIIEIMEYSISSAFLMKLEQIWHATPFIKKDKKNIIERRFTFI